jgi:hypothetical protein
MAGLLGQFGGALESTYGTLVTPNRFLEFASEDINLDLERIDMDAFRSATGARVRRSDRWYTNLKGASGPVSLSVKTKGMGWLHQLAVGAGAVTTPGGATLTRDQTFNLSDTPPSATMQFGRPDEFQVVRPFTYWGCMAAGWQYSCDLDGFLTLALALDAQNGNETTALAAASYASGASLFDYGGGMVRIAGAPYVVKGFTLTSDNKLDVDRRGVRNSNLKDKPNPAGFTDISCKFTIDFGGLGAYKAWTAGTLGTFSATFTGGLIEVGFNYGLTFSAPVIRIDSAAPAVKDGDVVQVDVLGTILHDPTAGASPLTILSRGTDTTI